MKRNNRAETVLVLSAGLIVFYLIYDTKVLLVIALCLIAIGLFSAYLTSKITWLWLGLANVLAFLSSRILLGIVFYVILTPLALLRKLFNKQVRNVNTSSYFLARDHEFNASDVEKPF